VFRSTSYNVLGLAAAGGIVAALYGLALIGEHYNQSGTWAVSVAQMDPARRLKAICDEVTNEDSAAAGRDPRKVYYFDAPVLQKFGAIYDLACGHKPTLRR
jgi:hypothetical protein